MNAQWLLISREWPTVIIYQVRVPYKSRGNQVIILALFSGRGNCVWLFKTGTAERLPHLIMIQDWVIINLTLIWIWLFKCTHHFVFASTLLSLSLFLFSSSLHVSSQTEGILLWPWCSSEWNQIGIWLQTGIHCYLLLWSRICFAGRIHKWMTSWIVGWA